MAVNNPMYVEWATVGPVEISETNRISVLHKLSQMNGSAIVNSCVRPLASILNTTSAQGNQSATSGASGGAASSQMSACDYLQNDRDVSWVMEVICFGLSLPLTSDQIDSVRDCVNIYCEWLYALVPSKARTKSIPSPIREDANLYCRKMIQHLYNVFIPRRFVSGQESIISDVLMNQALLCHRVLRIIEGIVQDESNIMDHETWDTLLIFLLSINDVLLAPPVETNEIGTELCERIVSVLFEIWLIACARSFSTASFWKTFQHLCREWRHRMPLIEQWNRINLALTQRVIQITAPSTAEVQTPIQTPNRSFLQQIVDELSDEALKQTWFRFLHLIGNPVELCFPEIISKTDKFYHSACASENVVDPRQHPCLQNLPNIFHKAMKGVANLVDTFLGICDCTDIDVHKSNTSIANLLKESPPVPSTPPEKRPNLPSLSKSSKIVHNIANISGSGKAQKAEKPQAIVSPQSPIVVALIPFQSSFILSPNRPKSTSILDILGDWLFSAALIGFETLKEQSEVGSELQRSGSSTSFTSDNSIRKASLASDRVVIETTPMFTSESFQAGQAEAIGALCRLFCSKRADEEISKMLSKQSHPSFQKVKNYLTKFHLALQHGLSTKEPMKRTVLASILTNSTKIFQVDLPGASLLIPHYLKAMESYLLAKEKLPVKSEIEIRRACIKLLLSLLSYPLHFNDLAIKDTLTEAPSTTFQSLRPRLINLLMQALNGETDSLNVQMLLGGFLLVVQDAAGCDSIHLPTETDICDLKINPLYSESVTGDISYSSNFDEANFSSPDNPLSDDGKGIPDTARGLYGRAIFHVGQILNKCREKNDCHISLAALEVLSALGRIHLPNSQSNCSECKDTVKHICSFIESQCEKPAPFHSKDMHSTIVASYQCLVVWYHQHSHLLNDKECIAILLEAIELGISGSKSKKNGYILKGDKQLKPASMRVREAAEALLTLLMNNFGACSNANYSPETMVGSSLLDETALLKYIFGNNASLDAAHERFKYFASDNSIMLAIFDQTSDKLDKETVCIIRSPFGKYCWSFKFQQVPRKHSLKLSMSEPVPRPLPAKNTQTAISATPIRYFPETVDKIPLIKLDTVVPTLDSAIANSQQLKTDYDLMSNIIDRVETHMRGEKQKHQRSYMPSRSLECKEPAASNDFEAARLILSHFGFLTPESLQEISLGQIHSLSSLDEKGENYAKDLKELDSISIRTSDTVFVFYVRKGKTSAPEILNSVKHRSTVSSQFREFLLTLGHSIDVLQHSGWTGHISTSWKINDEERTNFTEEDYREHGGWLYNGYHKALYWADNAHEIAFIVPSEFPKEVDTISSVSVDSDVKLRGVSDTDARSVSSMSDDGSTLSAHSKVVSESHSNRSSLRKRNHVSHNIGCDVKVLVVWLESMDDQYNIPINTLLTTTYTGVESNLSFWNEYLLIIIHPLKNGLFRLTLQGPAGRNLFALPLIDGMVVSKRILGTFVRLTSLNICRRRRLDAESYQPPHVKRRLKIQDMVNSYKIKITEPHFYNSLFSSK